jgi:uncharacterized protein YaaW (UPF0174 family)
LDELRSALELASDEELEQLTQLLFSRRFNPLDYMQTPEPLDIQSLNRASWLDALEHRFRYLAADGLTVLKGKTRQFSYRQALIQVCRYLKISYSQKLSTTDLEAEIFLSLIDKVTKRLPGEERKALMGEVVGSLQTSDLSQPLPLSVQKDPLSVIVKGGSAIAVSSIIQPMLLQQIARQFAIQFASYHVAKDAIVKGTTGAFQNYLALQSARQGMAITATRYGAVRTVFGILGPVLWTWFFADLGWKAISTNYGRIIPMIFALAQIRLTRSDSEFQPA